MFVNFKMSVSYMEKEFRIKKTEGLQRCCSVLLVLSVCLFCQFLVTKDGICDKDLEIGR